MITGSLGTVILAIWSCLSLMIDGILWNSASIKILSVQKVANMVYFCNCKREIINFKNDVHISKTLPCSYMLMNEKNFQ